ncbi:hypothetical protein AAG602_02540 [Citromicrobium bathyomarinum]
MIELPRNRWPDTPLSAHYLLFAQTVKLLLNGNAFESFRAPVLGNLMRAQELQRTCEQVIYREMPSAILTSIRDEFVKYIELDTTARSIIGPRFDNLVDIVKSANLSDYTDVGRIRHTIKLIHRQLSDFYEPKIRENLRSSLGDVKKRQNLINLTREYVTFLVNFGYDPRHIRDVTDDIFFSADINRVGTHLFSAFVSRFDSRPKDYIIFIPVKERDAKALKGYGVVSFRLKKLNKMPSDLRSKILETPQFSDNDHFYEHHPNAIDPYNAVSDARELFELFTSLTVLEPKGLDIRPRSYSFAAVKGRRKYRPVIDEKSKIQPTATAISIRKGESLERNLDSLLDNFDAQSKPRIAAAIRNISLARQTQNSESQITLIWSAIETLFGDPPKGSARLKYYRDSLEIGILVNYCWRYSYAIFNLVNYHYRKLLMHSLDSAGIDAGLDTTSRFQRFILDPAYRSEHRAFMAGIRHNPCLTQLVFSYYKKFGTGNALRRTVSDHEKRVIWQIDRIYRARNEFVHSGFRSPFADGIAINSYEYFRTSLQAILHHAREISGSFPSSKGASVEEVRESLRIERNFRQGQIADATLKTPKDVDNFLTIFDRV